MTEVPREQLERIITRVTEEFARDARTGEARAIAVADLQTQAENFNKVGGESTWTISYSTAAVEIEGGLNAPRVLGRGAQAWTISYSTAASDVSSVKVERGRPQ
jgi:hypothetical protein